MLGAFPFSTSRLEPSDFPSFLAIPELRDFLHFFSPIFHETVTAMQSLFFTSLLPFFFFCWHFFFFFPRLAFLRLASQKLCALSPPPRRPLLSYPFFSDFKFPPRMGFRPYLDDDVRATMIPSHCAVHRDRDPDTVFPQFTSEVAFPPPLTPSLPGSSLFQQMSRRCGLRFPAPAISFADLSFLSPELPLSRQCGVCLNRSLSFF